VLKETITSSILKGPITEMQKKGDVIRVVGDLRGGAKEEVKTKDVQGKKSYVSVVVGFVGTEEIWQKKRETGFARWTD